MDRKFVIKLKIGDNQIFEGKLWPIIYAGNAPNKEAGFHKDSSRNCSPNSLDIKLVKGKIVLNEDKMGPPEAYRVGAVGVLVQGRKSDDTAYSFPLPGCNLKSKDAVKVHKYIKSTRNPVASIFKTSELNDTLSPVAIRSALMTTAKQMSPDRDAEFAYGAGQIDLLKALYPGLVYDANEEDYIKFLCDQGLNMSILLQITESIVNCSERGHMTLRNLNYPSFAFRVPRIKYHLNASFKRIVTNVGLPMSTYRAFVTAPRGLNISVTTNILSFTSLGEKQNFILTINGKLKKSIGSTSLIWDDGKYQVRSSIVVSDERAVEGKGANLYRIDYIYIVIYQLL